MSGVDTFKSMVSNIFKVTSGALLPAASLPCVNAGHLSQCVLLVQPATRGLRFFMLDNLIEI